MKDIYRFTNNLHIFTLEVFILLKAQPVFTSWFLPVDQRQTHKNDQNSGSETDPGGTSAAFQKVLF